MSWRDQLRPAKLGSVPFQVDVSSVPEIGRNTQVHEYPLRDKPYVEDLGRKARKFELQCFVLSNAANGYNYMIGRDALIMEIEKPGSKVLTHPYFGDLNVTVVACNGPSESTREGGMARFSITFIESGELTFPTSKADTAIQVKQYADDGLQAVALTCQRKLVLDRTNATVTLLQRWARTLTGITRRVTLKTDVLSDFLSAASSLSGAASKLLLTPQTLTSDMLDLFAQIKNIVTAPKAALDIVRGLFNYGDDLDALPPSTATTRAVQANNREALTQFVQQAALLTAVQAVADIDFDGSDDALAVRDELMAVFDAQCDAADSDESYTALVDMRTTFISDIEQRAAQLDKLIRLTLPVSLPALVLAYELYDDATREADIVARNKISDPLFLPSGVELEVLSNG